MKKILLTIFLLIAFMLPAIEPLKIDTAYPRWFNYNGKRIYLINFGSNGIPRNADKYIKAGINCFRVQVFFNVGRSKLYNYRPGYGVDNNWGGYNSAYFKELRSQTKYLKDRNCFLAITIFGTPMRKTRHGTWSTHYWNEKNGGPIPSSENGVRAFHNLHTKEFIYTKRYQKSWPAAMKSQYRQEQVLLKFMQILPENTFSNVLFVIEWEEYSGHDTPWISHMVNLLQSISIFRPIGIGNYRISDLKQLSNSIKRTAFGVFEGSTYEKSIKENGVPQFCPIFPAGCHCRHSGFFSGGNFDKCKYFISGAEKDNVKGHIDNMIACLKSGMNTSMPFPDWWLGIGSYIKSDCPKSQFHWDKYNSTFVESELLKFLSRFNNFIKKIEAKNALWQIPRMKANRVIEKWRKRNGY